MMFSEQLSLSNLSLQRQLSTGFFSDTPSLSIQNLLGWDGINLEYYQDSTQIIRQESKQNIAFVFFSQGKIQQKFGEITQFYTVTPGSMLLIPNSVYYQISWLNPLDFAVLILKPSAIKKATEELYLKLDKVELKPQFEQSNSLVYSIVSTLLSQIDLEREGYCIYTETLCRTLAVHLFKKYASVLIQATKSEIELSFRLNNAIAYINENLDKKLCLAEIAQVANTSKYYFCNLFRQSMGISPYQYLLRQRIEFSKTLLKSDSELSIADISLKCGFANQSHFSKRFRQFTGVTPKAYRSFDFS